MCLKLAANGHKYGTVHIELPTDSEIYDAIEEIRSLIDPDDLAGDGLDTGPRHITVRYGLDSEDIEGIVEYLGQQKPFEVRFGATASFPPSESSEDAAVLIVPVTSDDLARLNRELAEHGEFTEPSFKDYRAHATVAYLKPEAIEKYEGKTETEDLTVEVKSITVITNEHGDSLVPLKGGKTAAKKKAPPAEDPTQTPAFKQWFGNSKVVDAEGKPQPVFHGTDAEFHTFDRSMTKSGPSKFGFWFTPEQFFAEMFGSNQMHVYLKMENPYRITSSKWNDIRDDHAQDTEWFERWREKLKQSGYDGLMVEGEKFTTSSGMQLDDPSVYAVFEPNQIKAVKGNSGKFDPEQPSILASAKPLTETPAFKRWFAGSKIVDQNGKPRVMYHGTKAPFTKVDMSQGAQGVFWLTSDRDSLVAGERGAQSSKTVLRCYVSMKNPAGRDQYEKKSLWELKHHGFDGVILPDKGDSFDCIVFKPNQVKILPHEEPAPDKVVKGKEAHAKTAVMDDIDHLPPAPGTASIPPGTLRLWHYTDPKNVDSIRRNGLLASKGKGDGGTYAEPSAGVWAATGQPDEHLFRERVFVEFWAPYDEISRRGSHPGDDWIDGKRMPASDARWQEFADRDSHIILHDDAKPDQIIAIHEPWQDWARYILENDFRNKKPNLLTEEFIGSLHKDDAELAKALRWVRDHATVPVTSKKAKHWLFEKRSAPRRRYPRYKRYQPPAPRDPQIDTPEFKQWFGNSVVKDLDGIPIKVHHGSPDARFLKEHGQFKTWNERLKVNAPEFEDDRAFWFTPDYATAASYADVNRAGDYRNAEPGVHSFYLKITNPLVVDNKRERWKAQTQQSVIEAKKNGYDGIIVKNVIDNYHADGKNVTTTYAVFSGSQIKAAKGNSGGFSPENKSVYATRVASEAVQQSPGFAAWFSGSKVVNPDGSPKQVYHGTGADIEHFDFAFTNAGADQHGSGFYFTDSTDTSDEYAVRRNSNDQAKPGGEQPNVLSVYLAIKKPIVVGKDERSKNKLLTRRQVTSIIEAAPDLDQALSNWGDVEQEGRAKLIREAVAIYGEGEDLLRQLHPLANDFYPADVKAFNEIVHKVAGYDGVIVHYGEETHYIAWFPYQIRSALSGHSFAKEGAAESAAWHTDQDLTSIFPDDPQKNYVRQRWLSVDEKGPDFMSLLTLPEALHKVKAGGVKKIFSPEEVKSSQKFVSIRGVQYFLDHPEELDQISPRDPVLVAKTKSGLWLLDGNHRATAAAILKRDFSGLYLDLQHTHLAAADTLDWRPILTEMMAVLKPGLPTPEVKVVNRKERWLGMDHWSFRYDPQSGQTVGDSNTTMYLQKSIMGDEYTLRRIIAHELCHHEDNLVNEKAKLDQYGFHTYKFMNRGNDGHGATWKAIAGRFNAKYGEDFVTPKSDETYVVDQGDIKPFFVLMTLSDQLFWQHATRLSPKMLKRLAEYAEGNKKPDNYQRRLFMTTDPFFQKSPTIGLGGDAYARRDEDKEKVQKLWNEGEDILARYGTASKTSAKHWLFLARPTEQKIQILKDKMGFDDEQVEQIIACDPSPNQSEFVQWIGKQVKQNLITLPEDTQKIHGQLQQFLQLKRSPRFEGNKDIGGYTPAKLYSTIEENTGNVSKKQEVRTLKEEGGQGAKQILNQDGIQVFEVTDPDQLMRLSSNTNWCTTQESFAEEYLAKGPNYIVYKDGKPYAQWDPDSNQLMDVQDVEMRLHAFDDCTVDPVINAVKKALPVQFKKVKAKSVDPEKIDSPPQAVVYAKSVIKGRFPEKEALIATDAASAVDYAENVLKGPFPAGEESISKYPDVAVNYAVEVLHGPFKKGEPEIIKDALAARKYACNALHGPFPAGEDIIATTALDSYAYAWDALKGPFPKGEPMIAANPTYAALYVKDVTHAPFPAAEDAIATDGQAAYMYAKALNQPFPAGEPAICTKAWTAFNYAHDVLKAPFPLGENLVFAKNPNMEPSVKYENWLYDNFPDAYEDYEKKIKTERKEKIGGLMRCPTFKTPEDAIKWINQLPPLDSDPNIISMDHFLTWDGQASIVDNFRLLDYAASRELIEEAGIETVQKGQLIASQEHLSRSTLTYFLNNSKAISSVGGDLPVLLLKTGLDYYIFDGHHRIVSQLLLGAKSIQGATVTEGTIEEALLAW